MRESSEAADLYFPAVLVPMSLHFRLTLLLPNPSYAGPEKLAQ